MCIKIFTKPNKSLILTNIQKRQFFLTKQTNKNNDRYNERWTRGVLSVVFVGSKSSFLNVFIHKGRW